MALRRTMPLICDSWRFAHKFRWPDFIPPARASKIYESRDTVGVHRAFGLNSYACKSSGEPSLESPNVRADYGQERVGALKMRGVAFVFCCLLSAIPPPLNTLSVGLMVTNRGCFGIYPLRDDFGFPPKKVCSRTFPQLFCVGIWSSGSTLVWLMLQGCLFRSGDFYAERKLGIFLEFMNFLSREHRKNFEIESFRQLDLKVCGRKAISWTLLQSR
jgi:hypothetical protein